MTLLGMPWIALASLPPYKCHQLAWFFYGCVERGHVLNVNACAGWWMRAVLPATAHFRNPAMTSRDTSPAVDRGGVIHETDQAEWSNHRDPL